MRREPLTSFRSIPCLLSDSRFLLPFPSHTSSTVLVEGQRVEDPIGPVYEPTGEETVLPLPVTGLWEGETRRPPPVSRIYSTSRPHPRGDVTR